MLINKGNRKENRRRQSFASHTGDKALLKNAWKTKFNQDAYIGPNTVIDIQNNGTVRVRRGKISPVSKNRNDFHYGAVCHRQV